jgi:predicted regulator of Ras-like GTPase activity (Roadblock/LC7/MglB family)
LQKTFSFLSLLLTDEPKAIPMPDFQKPFFMSNGWPATCFGRHSQSYVMHALKALWPGSTIKRWLGSQPSEAKPVAAAPPVPARPQAPAARVQTPAAKLSTTPPPAPINSNISSAANGDDKFLHLPLKPIFDRLSPALQSLANADQVSDTDEIALQIDNILAQLPGGVVRISFGELRHAAPVGIFGEQNSHDYTLIDVPLSEILERINPARLSLRADRKRIEVPPDVAGVFGKDGAGKVSIAAPETTQPSARGMTPAQPRPTAPAPHVPQVPAAMPTQPPRARVVIPPPPPGGDVIQFTRPTTPVAAPAPAPVAQAPVQSSIPMPPKVHSRAITPAAPVAPTTPAAPAAEEAPMFTRSAPIAMPTMAKQAAAPVDAPAPTVAAAPVVAATAAKPEPVGEPLIVPMPPLIENWPAPIKAELQQARPAPASVAIPLARLEGPMKTGKLNFRWSELRQWMKPTPMLGTSAHGDTEIQLALKVIAPLFFAHPTRGQAAKKKAEIAQDIPDVFGSTSAADAIRELASVPVAKLTAQPAPAVPVAPSPVGPAVAAQGGAATNLQLRMAQPAVNGNGNGAPAPSRLAEPTENAVLFAKQPIGAGAVAAANGNGNGHAAPANAFPKIDWTPEQAVKLTCATPGVAGVIIVATDGLMVATQLPAQFKSETLSAFVPQIFGRASQSAVELQLPVLNGVRLSFGEQQCEIFKTGKLYYVIIGKPNEELPTPFLRKVAAELTKRN